jgi:hypothetical protein
MCCCPAAPSPVGAATDSDAAVLGHVVVQLAQVDGGDVHVEGSMVCSSTACTALRGCCSVTMLSPLLSCICLPVHCREHAYVFG